MAKCDMCGKGRQFGHSVSYSKHATNRSWRPNVQKVKLLIDGQMKKMKVCTRCLRTQNRKLGV